MKINGSQILIETLLEQGVDTVFGYPGGAILNIYDALYKNSDRIRHIITAHEQGAAHAADGYARATGKTGVVMAPSGPGPTNLVTGIATAFMDSVPMVAITANVSNNLIGLDSFQEVYIAGITMPITKHNFVVRKVEELADTVRKAFRIAGSGRPGPVLIDITKDVTSAECEFVPQPKVEPVKPPAPDGKVLAEIAAMIAEAERPAILVGGGVQTSGASREVAELVKKADIPVTHTLMASGVLSYGEEHNLGMVGMHGNLSAGKMIANCDLLLAVGTRFSDRVATDKTRFAQKSKVVHIDIDAAEINKNIQTKLSVIGDVKEVLAALLPLVAEQKRPEWMAKVAEWKTKDYKPADKPGVLRPHQIMEVVSDALGEDGIIATDVGQHQMWAAQYCGRIKPRHFITSGGLGTMGFGFGAAMGAQVAMPDNRVVMITGDGSFHMNMNEMCTAVSFGLPIVVVVMNNHVLGMVRQWQTLFYEKRYSATTLDRKTDYVKLADAFGGLGFRATTKDEFAQVFAEALASGRPCIIDAVIDRDERVLPMIAPGCTIDDIIM